jgi:hypothetical protein
MGLNLAHERHCGKYVSPRFRGTTERVPGTKSDGERVAGAAGGWGAA